MLDNKYDFDFSSASIIADINRLTNQLWKLIPMRENNENWISQLDTVLIELIGQINIGVNKKKINSYTNITEENYIVYSAIHEIKDYIDGILKAEGVI